MGSFEPRKSAEVDLARLKEQHQRQYFWTSFGDPGEGRQLASLVSRQLRHVIKAAVVTISCPLLSACAGNHSVLAPSSPAADSIAKLAWIMFAGAGVVLLLVTALLLYTLIRSREHRASISPTSFIIGGGVVLPMVTLTALLVYSLKIQSQLTEPASQNDLVIEITGHQWWWEVRYLLEDRLTSVTTANEIHIPVGRPVELRLESADVIHTFWVPALAGKRDMIPGKTNRLLIEADRPGLFRGQCNEFCGEQHALMRFLVIGVPSHDFDRWLARQRDPARPPQNLLQQKGYRAFMASGCPVCHTVRGTDARGTTGPDLTHFGSRRSIAAVTLRNSPANREAWITSNQHIKPENRMPEFRLDAQTLRAISAYLGNLE